MDAKLFEKLVTTPGISGREMRIRRVVEQEISGLVDEVRTDRLGNLIGLRRGRAGAPKVMLAAHMDSIGFMVSHIDDDGFLRLSPVGGFDARNLNTQRVLVEGKNDFIGLMSPADKPVHLQNKDDAKKSPRVEDIFVDLMLPPDEVKANVSIGDAVSYHRSPLFTNHAVTAPYLDDRLGVYILIEALRRASDTPAEVHAVISVQEEVGLRGAATSAFEAEPDMGIAIDVTIAGDLPGSDKSQQVSLLGKGVALSVMDSGSISDPRLLERCKELVAKHDIKHQLEILPHGGTDAGAIQLSRAGVPVITISTPIRYVHTANEMAQISDIDDTIELVSRFLESAHETDLEW